MNDSEDVETFDVPMSFAQQRLWFLHLLEPDRPFYTIARAIHINGLLNQDALLRSLNAIVQRHEALRTTFVCVDGQPMQRITLTMRLPLLLIDLEMLPDAKQTTEFQRLAAREASTPFDLALGPLIRVTLLRMSNQKHILLLTLHHSIIDGWSLGIFFKELVVLYDACCADHEKLEHILPDLPIQYADFAAWQHEWLQGEVLQQQLSYWKQQLAGSPTLLTFPTQRRPAIQTFQGNHLFFTLDTTLREQLKALSQQEGVTLFMTLLAAFQVLLARYTGQHDIVVGSPIANRTRAEVEGVMGLFANTLVLRTDVADNPTFQALLARIRTITLSAYAQQDLPFEKLVEELQPQRDLGHNPLFQVMFAYQNDHVFLRRLAHVTFTITEISSKTSPFDVTLLLSDTTDGLQGIFEYNTDLFNASTIEQLKQHFQVLLQNIVAHPNQHISALPLMTEDEQKRLLEGLNATDADYPRDSCIHELFEQQVLLRPEQSAVSFRGKQLTYKELNEQANQMAWYLQALGVGPEIHVGICMERSLELAIALLAVLKAGGTYVALDPQYPKERLAFMLQDADIAIVLTQEHLRSCLPTHNMQSISMDSRSETVSGEGAVCPMSGVTSEHGAYIIYTSGSTGRPKGVLVPHRAVVNHNLATARRYGLQSSDRVLQFASISFDVAVEELFASWLCGATVIFKTPQVPASLPEFLQWVEQEHITVLNLPTPYWHEWVSSLSAASLLFPSALRVVVVGSDKALPEKLALWQKKVGDRVHWYNAYGPTEATITTTIYEAPTGRGEEECSTVPIGRPIANVQAYILDTSLQPVPSGVAGELYIGGAGVAYGYLNQPGLTAEKFLPHPFSRTPGERLYRTGDQARYLPDGTIEFLERLDNQVKIRGFRLELGEIEAALCTCPLVKACVVIAREEVRGEKRLVAYVVPATEQEPPTTTTLRHFLQTILPEYMLPSTFLLLPALPYTLNGKVDRRALPDLKEQRPTLDTSYRAPHTALEQSIAGIWQELLHVDGVGLYDNFFDLGGHSLLLLQVHHKLTAQFSTPLSIIDLFTYPTVHALAKYLSEGQSNASSEAPVSRVEPVATQEPSGSALAVIGMAGRFPGASTIDEFWQNICNGVESVTHFTEQELADAGIASSLLHAPNYVKANAVLEESDMFDAAFFGFTPKEAEITDPQHRIFLECAWEALEQAGYNPEICKERIGVYAGAGMNTYLLFNLFEQRELLQATGLFKTVLSNDKDYLPTRVSYKLNLTGPSVNINTACSTSLVTIHMACQSLLNGECDMALAGGVSLRIPQKTGYLYQEGGITSPDGHCRAFDADARGTVGGNGVGIVVLKRLADALADGDSIHAIVRGSAINNDGALKVGYTAPSVAGQAAVIAAAQAKAGISPDAISSIEAHGTGTPLGDPIELSALAQAFRASTSKKQFCAIGSVKTNIGHLDAAAGVAGFIKTVLSLEQRVLPPSLHFKQPNPAFNFAHSPFYVNDRLAAWETDALPRRAGVSSFGIGGTNAHVILEEASVPTPSSSSRPLHLVMLSTRSASATASARARLREYIERRADINIADLAYTLHVGRKAFPHRLMFVCRDRDDALHLLAAQETQHVHTATHDLTQGQRPVVFLFPGQGAQYVAMAQEIYQEEPIFRAYVDQCAELLKPQLGLDVRDLLYPTQGDEVAAAALLNQTWITQPVLFIIEYALAKLWMAWGIQPQAMIGHSLGEYTAASLAGVFSLEDALTLVVARGRFMQALPEGDMLAIPLPEDDIYPLLGSQLSLAAVNSPVRCVVSGPKEAINTLSHQLKQRGVVCSSLQTSHAFHSAMMDGILEPFAALMRGMHLSPPGIPYISNLTGTWITTEEATNPAYWAKHLRNTVRFADGLRLLTEHAQQILLEVGPGRTLGTLAKQCRGNAPGQLILSTLRHPNTQEADDAFLLHTLGQLWLAGVQVHWHAFYGREKRRRIPLPTYPFERKRYWIEPLRSGTPHNAISASNDPVQPATQKPVHLKTSPSKELSMSEPAISTASPSQQYPVIVATLRGIWGNLLGLEPATIDAQQSFLELGADSLLLLQASQAMLDTYGVKLPFRLLFEEYATIEALAAYIAQKMPEEMTPSTPALPALPPLVSTQVVPALQEPQPGITPSQNGHYKRTVDTDRERPGGYSTALEQIIAQQVQLMSQQLALLQNSNQVKEEGTTGVQKRQNMLPLQPYQHEVAQENGHTHGSAVSLTSTQKQEGQSASLMQAAASLAMSVQIDPETFVPHRPPQTGAMKGLTARQQASLDALVARLVQRTRGSKQSTQAYRPFLADSRQVAAFSFSLKEMAYPIVVQEGQGARVWDIDGNEYVDLTMGFGTLLFGHTPSFLVKVLEEQVKQGMRLGPQSDLAGKVAQLLCTMTGTERAFFCNSGTEAVMTALRLARTVTGRTKIAIFAGSYHGTFDGILAQAQKTQDGNMRTVPMAPGVPEHMIEDVLVLAYGEPESLQLLNEHAHELAAILVEPFQSRRPDLQVADFLRTLRHISAAAGTALIFDEVVTGFRTHPGGIQALLGIQADLTTYGKALGGGLPVGAIAGKAIYMDAIDGGMWQYGDSSFPQVTQTFVAGTYFKHPFIMAAVWAVLNHLQEHGQALQETLNQRTAQLASNINTFFEQEHLPIRVIHFSSLFRFVFPPEMKLVEANVFYYHLLEKGIYIWEGRNCFLSTAHTDEDTAQVLAKVKESIADMRAGGFFPASPSDTPPDKERVSYQSLAPLNTTNVPSSGETSKRSTYAVEQDVQYFPLTAEQKEVWFLAHMGRDASLAYSQSLPLDIHGKLDTVALHLALQEVVNRHEALRTTFSPTGEYQCIAATTTLALPLVDLSVYAASQHQSMREEWIAKEAQYAFDLEHGPLLRAHLIKLGQEHHQLVLTYHHIIIDGVSAGTLMQELGHLYSARCQQKTLQMSAPTQYSEYVQWQERQQTRPEMTGAESFWLDQFAVPVPALELPTDFSRPSLKTYQGARCTSSIDASLFVKIRRLCLQQRCTPVMLLLAGYQVLLHRLTGQDDIVVGIPSSGQQASGAHHLIGHCVNMLPLRTRLSGNIPFTAYLALVKKTLLDAQEHQLYPFSRLVNALRLPRDPARLPLLATTFNLDRQGKLPFHELDVTVAASLTSATQFDLCWNLSEVAGELHLECHYNSDLFAQSSIQRWMRHWETLLEQLVTNPEQGVREVPLLTLTEQEQLFKQWNDTAVPPPDQQCIHQQFEAQARLTPFASAVVYGETQLTYQELNEKSNQLAHYLQARGVQAEVLVGLYVERSLEMIIGILGILKAGGAYVPLDPSYPQERIAYMLTDTHMPLLVSTADLLPGLPDHQATTICLDADGDLISRESALTPSSNVTPENLAYVIYTSGSTGRPKGVLITHHNLVYSTFARMHYYRKPVVRYLLLSSFAFDSSVAGIFWTVCQGGTLVLPPKNFTQDLTMLPGFIQAHAISHMLSVPSLYRLVLAQAASSQLASLQTVIVAGEICPKDLVERHMAMLSATELFNEYGPTEGTVWSSVYQCHASSSGVSHMLIPIGLPITNVQLYLLDAFMQLVPIGVCGEIYIGGSGLGRGYLNQPTMTAENFVPHPFSTEKGQRLYRTGDLARALPDGTIIFLKRSDTQVKIRGYRIELGEIETLLEQHPAVQAAVVQAREDEPGHKHLVAYIVQDSTSQEETGQNGEAAVQDAHVAQYRAVYDQFYSQQHAFSTRDQAINARIWTSSYTNQPLSEEEVLESVEDTVQRILALRPRRVLEIGCGTGLLLLRIAPHCSHYCGLDISAVALEHLRKQLSAHACEDTDITLLQGAAHELATLSLTPHSFDTIIINEVVQHFPNMDYLMRVLEDVLHLVKPGGAIFIGGLRNLSLLRVFHTSVQLHRTNPASTLEHLRQRVQEHLLQEKDLVVDPAFFTTLPQRLAAVSYAQVQLKGGHHLNEMTRFKYDVVLRISMQHVYVNVPWRDWRTQHATPEAIQKILLDTAPEVFGLKHVPNARLSADINAFELLTRQPDGLRTVADLRQAADDVTNRAGIDPTRWWSLEQVTPYTVTVTWSHPGDDGSYDVLCMRRTATSDEHESQRIVQEERGLLKPPHLYANTPLQGRISRKLIPQLRKYLQDRLPEYMVPSLFALLDALPLMPNGKVDRHALPVPERLHPEQEEAFVAPRTSTEQRLADIWMQMLSLNRVGIHDNFFDLGGDSILSIQIIARANKEGLQLTPQQLFQHQTIAELATIANQTARIRAEQGVIEGPVPLTPIQHWFFEQALPNVHYRNQAMLLKIRRPLDPMVFQQALQYLLEYHDALRLRFSQDMAGWQQHNAGLGETISFMQVDLTDMAQAEQTRAIEHRANELHASLNISTGPLVRAVHFSLGEQASARLLLIIHHLAVDGVSWRILLDDLQTCCQQLAQGEIPQLPPKTSSFKHWAERLTRYAGLQELRQELPYWLSPNRVQAVPFPLDFPDAANTTASTALLAASLSVEETRILLQEVPKVYHTQIGDLLLTALTQTVAQWMGQRSLLIDVASHGREDFFEEVDLSRTVGWLTALAPIVLELGESDEPGQQLLSMKEQLRRIPHKGLGYGVLRYLEDSTIIAQLRSLPQAEILFNYLGQFDQLAAKDALFESAPESSGSTQGSDGMRRHLIEVNGFVENGQLQFLWVYSAQMHHASTIEHLVQNCIANLQRLITHCLARQRLSESSLSQTLRSSHHDAALSTPAPFHLAAEQRTVAAFSPLLPSQHWFFEQPLPNRNYWNQVMFMEARQLLDVTLLRQALQAVLAHHAALRARFIHEASHWQALDGDADEKVAFTVVHIAPLPAPAQLQIIEQVVADAQAGLDITHGPLLRAVFFEMGTQRPDRLLLVIHHLAVDIISWKIIMEDLHTGYQQLRQGRSVHLPLQTTSPRQWASRLHAYAQSTALRQELPYWLSESRKHVGTLPVDTPQGVNTEASARSVSATLGIDDTQYLLQELPGVYQVQTSDVLLAAFALTLARWMGERIVLVDIEGHGREDIFEETPLARTVGWLTAVAPVVLDTHHLDDMAQVLHMVKAQLRHLPHGGIGYSVLRYMGRDASTAKQLAQLPQAEVLFNYLGRSANAMSGNTFFVQAQEDSGPLHDPRGLRSHKLDVQGVIVDRQLRLQVTYSEHIHRHTTIERLIQHCLEEIRLFIQHTRFAATGSVNISPLSRIE